MTYPLGWSIIPNMLIRRERWPGGYHSRSSALVYPGQKVQADQIIMRLEMTEGTSPGVHASQQASESRARQRSRIILSGISGRVVEITPRGGVVIESRAVIIQGTIGAGNQVAGKLTFWNSSYDVQLFAARPSNTAIGAVSPQAISTPTILIVPGPLNFAMLRQAMNMGVAGVVASSISSRDLESFLGTNLISLISSRDIERANESLPPITLLFTEGLGTVAMPPPTVNLLSQYQGSMALLSGLTFIRQSIYPELIISLPEHEFRPDWQFTQPDPILRVGAQVRICSGSYEGAIGEIIYLYIYKQKFASGIKARAARVRLEDGSTIVVPLFLLERIG
ncbi:MAG TPA: hypothetical protein VEI53_04945 [Ktedonobacteraceae bacterium]|nr:hypothetical protein [Ktedonobacteraceae bacterium]